MGELQTRLLGYTIGRNHETPSRSVLASLFVRSNHLTCDQSVGRLEENTPAAYGSGPSWLDVRSHQGPQTLHPLRPVGVASKYLQARV